MKKIICVMIIGTLLICTFFAGCGKTEDGKVSDTNNASQNSETNSGSDPSQTKNGLDDMLTDASESLSSGISEVSTDVQSAVDEASTDMTKK